MARGPRPTWASCSAELGLEPEIDEAGNLWARLEGSDPAAPAVVVGSHIDSVPDGGWLDGALGVMAGLGVLRAWAGRGEPPPRPLVLVDWADEEGARFGRSLFGSSAFSGTLDPAGAGRASRRRAAPDRRGPGRERGRARRGRAIAPARRDGARRLPRAAHRAGPADGGGGPARRRGHRLRRGRAAALRASPGRPRTPARRRWTARHDAGLAAAEAALEIERIPAAEGGVATTGELRLEPGIPTAVAGRATLSVDLRHPEAEPLARMLEAARGAVRRRRRAPRLRARGDAGVADRADPASTPGSCSRPARRCAEVAGEPASMASGALHDAAEVARVLPAVMLFAPSKRGISHAPEEDTAEADLAVAIEAFAALPAAPAHGPRRVTSLTRSLQELHKPPRSSLQCRAPNLPPQRRGSGGPKDSSVPGANRPRTEP